MSVRHVEASFRRSVDASATGRTQAVVVSPRNDITMIGCDGPLTPTQAAAARTLLDDALAFVAEREGPQSARERAS